MATSGNETQIITGDAVLLEVRPARVPARVLSALVDMVIVLIGNLLWTWVLWRVRGESDALFNSVDLIGYILISLGYPIATETLTRGRTVGALATGLRVTRDDGGVIRFRHALIRWITFWAVDVAPWTALLGGLVCACLHPQGKRIGDLLAGTMVVRVRAPRPPTELPEVPPELAAWAARLELGRVPSELLTAARQFIQRRQRLLRHPRTSIAKDLASKIYARTSPPPPSPLEPEDYLAVVVAERRRREIDRINGARQEWVPTSQELPAGWR
ncbi:MAG TPA: RDD family protein [Candidatus Avipropionibacterium avicola]|uniref:RDD family protein n=1 Tax=Candidatus Avipropionibacterium avicola TaxID=2840701 RepID=A0A9D1H1K9_9ACTN|nr:RDD family protein [Candidatus Avipropionibacterium avicola]